MHVPQSLGGFPADSGQAGMDVTLREGCRDCWVCHSMYQPQFWEGCPPTGCRNAQECGTAHRIAAAIPSTPRAIGCLWIKITEGVITRARLHIQSPPELQTAFSVCKLSRNQAVCKRMHNELDWMDSHSPQMHRFV